jgi:predicted acylesterase/phospholipase RssA
MAAQRDQSQDDSSSNNGSDAAAQNGTPAEDGSEQPSASQGSGEPELGRGSLAPDQAGEPPPDVERKSMTYREMLADWFYTRETDLRSLAAEGRLQLRNFLADPSVTVLGRDVSFPSWMKLGRDFDLKKFTGSFSRVADFSAWYPSGKAAEDAAADEDARGSIQEVGGRHPAAIAFEKGGPSALGFGFSAGGLLFSYYIGVIFGLHDLGIVTRDTKLAGASAGSLIAACYHSGLPEDLITKACFTLAKDCRDNGTRGRLGSVLVKFLEELLPDDIHEKCRDKAYVAVTRVFPRPTPELISDFESKSDLIAALLTSCHIPWWFDKRVWTSFRGQASYDGGLTNFIPLPPVEHGVRVCCFASKQITSVVDIQISPDNFVEFEHGIQQMVAWAFEPADDKKLEWFIEKGRADAKAWAEATGVLALVGPENQKKQEGVQRATMTEDADAAEGTAAPA